MSADILYTVFAPTAALSRSRWNYYQHLDGRVTRTITSPKFGESKPDAMRVSPVFPDALAWARCLHQPRTHFEDSPEAEEIYSVLCNVTMHLERGSGYLACVCLDGLIENCQEWKRRLQAAGTAALPGEVAA